MISLAGGLPDPALFPVERLAEIAAAVVRRGDSLQYGATAGDAHARAVLATLFDPQAEPGDVVVTTGSQQALDLISRVVVNPGDQVIVADADYLGALQVFRSHGAEAHAIAIDADGLRTDMLEDALRLGLRPKSCYIVPHFHNPTGATMAGCRRRHLNELSARYGFLVIEDDPYRQLFFDGTGPIDVPGDPELTVRLRSASKTLAPGLRVGALEGPAWLVNPLVTAKQSADLHTSSLSQAVVARALESEWMRNHLNRLRSTYRSKRDVLVAALRSVFGDRVSFQVPSGGMFLWVRFDGDIDTTAWLTRALDQGVCFVPGAAFAVDRDLPAYARFSYSNSTPTELEQAVTRLAASL